ncbi:MAG: hypothetical protein E7641_08760 [Ruminococcaceae bacterium]|nr:hypothetical protein [Oscillospiraceae bacterium]
MAMPDPEREITGGYVGDLLSWVMGRAKAGDAWVTIMSNVNIIAVATLADPACIILSEGVRPDAGVIERAEASGVNLLGCEKDSFAVASQIAREL